jgi:hypothetical protein
MRGKFQDLTGKTFDRLFVLGRILTGRQMRWSCLCECGGLTRAQSGHLLNGQVRSCGCLVTAANARKRLDITGQRFGRLVATRYVDTSNQGHAVWLMTCDCGGFRTSSIQSIQRGDVVSCGCARKATAKERAMKYGMPRIAVPPTEEFISERHQ